MPVKNAKRPLRVLITGAGKGVGFACACAFAHRGAELILTDSDPEALTRASDFVDGFSRFCDVLSETSVAIFAEHFAQDFGSFDVLINAAGEGYVRSLGMVRMSSALLPVLRRGEGERLIVNFAPCCQDGDDQGLFRHGAPRLGFDQL